ncbi:MAG: hypothetical protein IPJ74_06810 [Saprospiraceae bacterium]|nr:hypothetical protein [Saprospiraceae bacterium]
MMTRIHFFIFIITCFLYLDCDSNQTQQLSAKAYISDLPTRDELMNAFRESRKILIVYGSLNPDVVDAYAGLSKNMRIRSRNTTVEVKPCSDVTVEDWQTKAIVLIGTKHSNSVLHKIAGQIPFTLYDNEINFNDKIFKDASTIAMLSFYPNPLFNKLPVSIITAANDNTLKSFLEYKSNEGWRSFGWSSWNYEIYQYNKRVMMGMFDGETWALDKKVHFDFTGEEQPIIETLHYRFLVHQNSPNPSAIQNLAQEIESTTENILNFIDSTATLPIFNYNLYASAEDKGLIINNSNQANADFIENEIHTVFNDAYHNNLIGKENELIIRHLLGEPKTRALENGLAVRFTQKWQFKGYEYWTLRLFQSNNLLSLSDLLNNEMLENESPLVTGCLSASFTDFLIERWGREVFLQKYKIWQPEINEIKQLDKDWRHWLSQKAKNVKIENKADVKLPYLKGFNFAHEGYAIFNGYLSKLATESIDKQANELNCNALSIIPYSFMDDPNQPSYIPISNSAGGENDEGVVHSALSAKKRGMTVMLKPQLWMGRGYWPGDVAMRNDADWQQFFEYYHRWMRHYAMLAEIWNIDILCIGTELAKTTQAREQDWRVMIKKLRGLYSGKITYAANWGAEFENFPLGDALDYVGVDCYYPLSNNPNATKEELSTGFAKILDKLEKVQKQSGKPLIFTEIGFKSVKTPWLKPHEPSGDADYFGEHQKLCYEVVFENIRNKKWINGIFWWKFPSYLEYRGAENDDFNPNRKPAEQVVKEWFGKMP